MNPYAIIAAIGVSIALAIGGFFYGKHVESLSWQTAVAKQSAQASQLLTEATQKARDAESKASDLNAQLESTRHAADLQTASAATDLSNAQREWLRKHPRCGIGGTDAVSHDQSPTQPANPSPGSVEILPAGSAEFIQSTASAADELGSYARECHAFISSLTP